MTASGPQPFDTDIDNFGQYIYTDSTRKSCAYVSRRHSDITLASFDFDGKRVLDIGCGDGTYTAVLRAETRAAAILGIDPATKAIERAKRLYDMPGLAFQAGTPSDLIEAGEAFDIAVFRGVLHHVDDPAKEIEVALRLAQHIFILEPNGWNPILKVIEQVSPYHRAHQEKSYRLGQYDDWIRRAQGKIEQAFYYGLVPIFCPDWLVTTGSACEPMIEGLAGIRTLVCGQIAIRAARQGT